MSCSEAYKRFCNALGIPAAYIDSNRGLLISNSKWFYENLSHHKISSSWSTFVEDPSTLGDAEDIAAYLSQLTVPNNQYEILEILYFVRKSEIVFPLNKPSSSSSSQICSESWSYSDFLYYVSSSNFTNLWKESYKFNGGKNRNKSTKSFSSCYGLKSDVVLMDAIKRYFKCPSIYLSSSDLEESKDEMNDYEPNDKALAVFIDSNYYYVIKRHQRYNIHQALSFSWLLDSHHKLLFIVYQILLEYKNIHSMGLSIGDINLSDININSSYYITLNPNLSHNLIEINNTSEIEKMSLNDNELAHELAQEIKMMSKNDTSKRNFFLNKAILFWKSGDISNYDYLMLLNFLCGRTFHNPNYYPVLPWVRDFTSENGGWRDFTKSKFRLNKGDQQLDLTYDGLLNHTPDFEAEIFSKKRLQAPHHVSDVLSEITYYVYKARRTSKSVLCRYVRNRWVPHEYPSTMSRLFSWTPDECIPDFYTDPDLFNSIHDDLPHLQLPTWTKSSKDFISWHRNALESNYVSERLHHWIDLTFGFKLGGNAAVRAKNVCLHLVDNHSQVRDNGIVQLFNMPHPPKDVGGLSNIYRGNSAPIMDMFVSFHQDQQQQQQSNEDLNTVKISLPKDYDPLDSLNELESLHTFMTKSKSVTKENPDSQKEENDHIKSFNQAKELSHKKLVRDVQNLGCLLIELFLPKKFSILGPSANLESRFGIARQIIIHEFHTIPLIIRETVSNLINHQDFKLTLDDRYPVVNQNGLPPPSPKQLLMPFISTLPFPSHFENLYVIIKTISMIKNFASILQMTNENEIGEWKVKFVASKLIPLFEYDSSNGETIEIILPLVKDLFDDPQTRILSVWHLFDPVSGLLGPNVSLKKFLEAVLNIYESTSQTSKHLKLYHRNFLLILIKRFGTKIFLEYFITFLIEAVGGYKDFEADKKSREGLERSWIQTAEISSATPEILEESTISVESSSVNSLDLTEGEVFAFDQVPIESTVNTEKPTSFDNKEIYVATQYDIYEDMYDDAENSFGPPCSNKDGNISQVAAESVIWLSHRLGPVLSAKYLSANLLRMLNLCYMGSHSLITVNEPYNDQKIRISTQKIQGDVSAENVLICLASLANLYGEQLILLQYIPYACELISLCKKKLTPNMEGGIIGCISLIHSIVPLLSDSIIMNELQDTLLTHVLFPILQLITSRSVSFVGGFLPRKILMFKLLDVIYLIGLRIGEEMSRTHFTPLCSAFFSAFEKVYNADGTKFNLKDNIEKELVSVLCPEVAYSAYVAYYHLLGRTHLESSIINLDLIQALCQNHSVNLRPVTFAHLRIMGTESNESPASLGNKIGGGAGHHQYDQYLQNLICQSDQPNSVRHLRGNWLAYWEHEIGRSTNSNFMMKQIKLQSFSGHSAGIKSLHVLDNENSFLSSSRDKTVKVWSLRSQSDESSPMGPQWTYSQHKKSVHSVTFMDSLNIAASCDGTIHLFDPFVGSSLHQYSNHQNVNVLISCPSPSRNLLSATLDSSLHLHDVRSKSVTDLKVCVGSAGLIRSLSVLSDGYNVTIGHSSGVLSNLDLRTGRLRHAWKAHEGEILSLTPIDGQYFISTSLDQTMSVWSYSDGKSVSTLLGSQEPVHCVCAFKNQIITGSTANRIGVRNGITPESNFTSAKLKSDMIKGNLTSMKFLAMNQFLLLGQDVGNIHLVC